MAMNLNLSQSFSLECSTESSTALSGSNLTPYSNVLDQAKSSVVDPLENYKNYIKVAGHMDGPNETTEYVDFLQSPHDRSNWVCPRQLYHMGVARWDRKLVVGKSTRFLRMRGEESFWSCILSPLYSSGYFDWPITRHHFFKRRFFPALVIETDLSINGASLFFHHICTKEIVFRFSDSSVQTGTQHLDGSFPRNCRFKITIIRYI